MWSPVPGRLLALGPARRTVTSSREKAHSRGEYKAVEEPELLSVEVAVGVEEERWWEEEECEGVGKVVRG